jgi:hypothetical protein
MRRINILALLVSISLSSLGQESNTSKTSFSFSYVTPYVVLIDWELGFLPLQTNFHFKRNPGKTDSFAKLVFNNILFLDKVAYFENDIATSEEKSISYIPAIGFGVGTRLRRDKPLGILLEGVVEKHLRFDGYSDGIWCSAKVGIII